MRDDEQIVPSSGRPQLTPTNGTTAPPGLSAPSFSQLDDDLPEPAAGPAVPGGVACEMFGAIPNDTLKG